MTEQQTDSEYLDSPTGPRLYKRTVLERPLLILALLTAVLVFFAWQARHFSLDASADALLLENDKDLQIYRQASQRYDAKDLLVVTYTSNGDLLDDTELGRIEKLRDELLTVQSVDSVFSLLEVPLMISSGISLAELSADVPTLNTHRDFDREKVRAEISGSPVFGDLILSADGTTTAVLLSLKDDEALSGLFRQRSELRLKQLEAELSVSEARELANVNQNYEANRRVFAEQRHNDIAAIRAIMQPYKSDASLHLGGVPMVSDDMISYISRDLITFGAGVLLFIIATLAFIFRRLRWVMLPIASCLFSGLFMGGLLGFVGWKVTVISSNFISLMLIITMSMNIHLVVRFRQLTHENPQQDHVQLVWLATRRMFWPCLYTALTTIIGFSSLVFSGIKPVMDFGWMMSIGLCVTFLTSFLLFPSLLVLIGPLANDGRADEPAPITAVLANITQKYGAMVLLVAAVIAALSAIGISRLQVENSFINYFRDHTEIYQGMKLIDEQLGGTTPVDVLLDLRDEDDEECADSSNLTEDELEYCEEIEFLREDSAPEDYWFTPFRIERIKAVHDYLESLPEVGKVLSLASILRVGESINDGEVFTPFELAILYKRIPDDIRERMIEPYISVAENEGRISLRVLDSLPDLRRRELLQKIRTDLSGKLEIPPEKATVSGILVLYNNMLQSLFQSQIQTIGAVLLGIAVMFLVLFRSLKLAIAGIVPNALAAAMVMGIMGLAGIPLDMMTITIATITIGIAVDNSIHYIYRFREEYAKTNDYIATMKICHANIGRAVLFTSATIIFGFSILVLSNFIPTIVFGLLTALAMFAALIAVLTLLPRLILMMRPF